MNLKNLASKLNGHSKREGRTTMRIEQVTATIPSSTWLVLAGGALVGSLALRMLGRHSTASFVGEWVPAILMLGLYNKIVKLLGSERVGARMAH